MISCIFSKEPILNVSCSYSNGLLNKQSTHLKSICKSGKLIEIVILNNLFYIDTHCLCSIKFNHQNKPNQCECNGQFQFEIGHCNQLLHEFDEKLSQ